MVRYKHASTILRSIDIQNSLKFYKTVFNFEIDYISGNPPVYAVIFKDEVYFHLSNEKVLPCLNQNSCVFMIVDAIDEIYEKCVNEEVRMINPLELRDHGQGVVLKEFTIMDIDGNTLRIGELRQGENSN